MKADIGLIGLAVMGENLVLNMENKGYTVAVYNRSTDKVDRFINGRGKGKKFIGTHSIPELTASLTSPRKVMMLVKAGQPVDDLIAQLIPHLDKGDIIIDGGNSNYEDTIRRAKEVESHDLLYVGSGVSGGEEGALNGPSLMPGGSPAAWPFIKDIFQNIAAKVEDGTPCCDWVGENGAGHFVKMVHNGIEYGDMQIISEAYSLMKNIVGMNNEEIQKTFVEWNKGDLNSYLIEITANILTHKDGDGHPLVEKILDTAGQKGTGKWAGISALDFGVPLTLIVESVFARALSANKEERINAARVFPSNVHPFTGDKKKFLNNLKDALFASKIISYTQGYLLMREAARQYDWNLNYGGIALMWRGGCIIRSVFLNRIKEAFDINPDLENLLMSPFFSEKIRQAQKGWRNTVAQAALEGTPVPAFSAALSYFDGVRSENLPANLIQAQRDYFGAHTYERVDRERGLFFHTNWTGHGGNTASSSYNV